MNYFKGVNYNIIPYLYSDIDQKFIEKTFEIFHTQPIKWYDVFENIINNQKYVYLRDTTMIVTLGDISKNDAKDLFELLKIYLRIGAITKIIHKKEFLIVNLASNNIAKLISNRFILLVIDYYFSLKEYLDDVYLGGILESNKQNEYIDIIIKKNERIILINTSSINTIIDNNHSFYQLFLYHYRGMKKNLTNRYLQYYFSKEMQVKTIESIMI